MKSMRTLAGVLLPQTDIPLLEEDRDVFGIVVTGLEDLCDGKDAASPHAAQDSADGASPEQHIKPSIGSRHDSPQSENIPQTAEKEHTSAEATNGHAVVKHATTGLAVAVPSTVVNARLPATTLCKPRTPPLFKARLPSLLSLTP